MALGKSLEEESESTLPPSNRRICHELGEELYQHRDHSSVIILIKRHIDQRPWVGKIDCE